MSRSVLSAACAAACGVLILSATAVQAAPGLQGQEPSPSPSEQPTETPTPGGLGRLATPPFSSSGTVLPPGGGRPTPTLIPPPGGGGRVAVEALYVRDAPSFAGVVLGIVPYNQSVYPVGRNGDATWIAINWGSARGWIYAEMVVWDPSLSLASLTVLVQATGVPPTPSPGPTGAGSPTLTSSPTETPEPVTASPSPTSSATATATRVAAATQAPTLQATSLPGPVATAQPPGAGLVIPGNARLPLAAGAGLLILAALLYGWQWSAGRAEVRRYARGFVLSICPVCQEGHIHLDEVVRATLGIKWVRRSARCDNCRSVIREIRPGVWRYSVDAFVNPEMAKRFGTRPMTNAELQALAEHVVLKPTQKAHDEPTAESLRLKWLEIDEPMPPESDRPLPEDRSPDEPSS